MRCHMLRLAAILDGPNKYTRRNHMVNNICFEVNIVQGQRPRNSCVCNKHIVRGQRWKVKGERSKVKGQRWKGKGERSKVKGKCEMLTWKVKGQRWKVKSERSKVKVNHGTKLPNYTRVKVEMSKVKCEMRKGQRWNVKGQGSISTMGPSCPILLVS